MAETREEFIEAFEIDWNRYKELTKHDDTRDIQTRGDWLIHWFISFRHDSWNMAQASKELEDFCRGDWDFRK